MIDHATTYTTQADQYEQLVAHEDCQGNIRKALDHIRPPAGLDVIELGAGTGRLTCLAAPVAQSIVALDVSPHMLQVARAKLQRQGARNWRLAAADHRALPLQDRTADLALAGWTIGQMVAWHQGTWEKEVGLTLAEVRRVLRPGGTIVILETLGTGHATPHPHPKLLGYTSYLESIGFSSTCIRTDFEFESPTQAQALLGFFFGADSGEQWSRDYGARVPECTGVWWHTA
jgi:ubiquinone/menaquinone biosynthesis C-methylase UbiE